MSEQEKDELVLMVLGGLAVVGVWRAAKAWWIGDAPAWLQSHGVLLPPGEGVLHLGRLGSMDPARILSAVLVLVILRLVVVSMAGEMSKSRARKSASAQGRGVVGQG